MRSVVMLVVFAVFACVSDAQAQLLRGMKGGSCNGGSCNSGGCNSQSSSSSVTSNDQSQTIQELINQNRQLQAQVQQLSTARQLRDTQRALVANESSVRDLMEQDSSVVNIGRSDSMRIVPVQLRTAPAPAPQVQVAAPSVNVGVGRQAQVNVAPRPRSSNGWKR